MIFSITDGVAKGPAVGKDANGKNIVHDSRCIASPNGPVALPYATIIDLWNTNPHLFLPISLADLNDICRALRQPVTDLLPADVTEIGQQVAAAVVAQKTNQLTKADVPGVADAVADEIAARLGVTRP